MGCQEFVKSSMTHEALFVGNLWNNPKLYKKYKNYDMTEYNEKTGVGTFTIGMWYFFMKLGEKMVESGVQKFNDTTVYSFISSQPDIGESSWVKKYKKFGGFQSINSVMEECNHDENNDIYHLSEIQKFELLRYFESNGLLDAEFMVEKKGKKYKNKEMLMKMSLEQVRSYFQYFMKKGNQSISSSNIVVSNLTDGLDEAINEFNLGESMGIPLFESPRLNKIIKGFKQGGFYFLIMSSGVGKSSFCLAKFDLGILHSNEKMLHGVNEENKKRAQSSLLSTISSTITNSPISRERMSEGSFTKDEWNSINKAKNWLQSKPADQIRFAEIEKFYLPEFIEAVEIHKSLGYNFVCLDTFKPDSSKSSETQRWEKFSAHAQDIFDTIKPSANNMGCLATLQLKIGSESKYLDLDSIAKAKEVVETCDVCMNCRLFFEDEYDNLAVYDYKNSAELGWHREQVLLDKDKQYMIMFISKNRHGSKSEQIVYEIDYNYNKWTEIGYCNMKKTSR